MGKNKTAPKKYTSGWLEDLDGRCTLAQIMRERYRAFTNDLGGEDALSYQQRSLIERSLWLEYWIAQQEKQLAAGQKVQTQQWIQVVNSLKAIYAQLGLDRQAKQVPDLKQYLVKKKGAE